MDNEKEMQAMFDAAKSKSLKEDMRRVKSASQNPFYHNGKTDLDAYIKFLNAYNVFINHKPKPFKPMICNNMKL
ncbi:MAG: hypothetical protein FP814_15295 [Desulfobacterium sp.]|nr:hypothetical protein [Desulfobacterium sp.]MBU3947914.1 hypothetical protein [Pseudomonadota bacterium]MBU4009916.1 hypothetical protein [Pseudomonadota bacterium]MBU4036310.1 hypothetical protein [Pseudomonadota bacterium]